MPNKHKSITLIRTREIGRCIRLLHGIKADLDWDAQGTEYTFNRAVHCLGQYKRQVKDAAAALGEKERKP